MLEKEYEYYQKNRAKFVKSYLNQHVVIKNDAVLGVYTTLEEAVSTTLKDNELGSFLVKQVEPEEQTVRFYNRVFT